MKKNLLILAIMAVAAPFLVSAQASNQITFNPSTLTMYVGEAKSVTVSGSNSLYIGSNGNPAVASATFSNPNTLLVSSYLEGTNNISVCAYGSTGGVSCGALGVTVLKKTSSNSTYAQSASQATISFSTNQATMNVGDNSSVTVTGSGAGSYYVSTNSNSEVVSATVVGGSNTVSLTAQSVGGSNITICQFGGTCGTFYAYVPPTTNNLQAAQKVTNKIPLLSAFYVSSNNVGGSFTGVGATLTIKFNTSETVVLANLKVAGKTVPVTGSGSGPFSGTYVVTGSEAMPMSVYMDFATAANVKGQASLSIAGETASVTPAAVSSASSVSVFTRYLSQGSSGSEVTAMQAILSRLGFLTVAPTGYFGPQTQAAVKKYQSARGLSPVGYVGPGTRAALNKDAAR